VELPFDLELVTLIKVRLTVVSTGLSVLD